MRLGQHLAHYRGGLAGIDEVIDDQHALAAPAADADDTARHVLEHLELALRDVVVARHAYRLDQPDAELARDDRGGHQTAAGYADDRLERAGASEPPRERARITMELVPRDRKGFLRLRLRLLERLRHRIPRPERGVLAHVEHKIEPREEPVAGLGHSHHQLAAEQSVAAVHRLVWKIELGGEHALLGRLDIDVVVGR